MFGKKQGGLGLADLRVVALSIVLAPAFGVMTGSASASTLCVKESANGAVKGPTTVHGNTCKSGYETVELPSSEEMEVLKHTKYVASGIGGKPTIVFSGLNVQVVNGAGSTRTTNGEGNLVIGYDENTGKYRGRVAPQTGSHNLIVGEEQEFTSYGGIDAGWLNNITGPFDSVSGGYGSTASGEFASVSGGDGNLASGPLASSVSGGVANTASASGASVSGGGGNTASQLNSSVNGGGLNKAEAYESSISGGQENKATSSGASILGGYENTAGFQFSTIYGGKNLSTKAEFTPEG
jgi:hypothetical protein